MKKRYSLLIQLFVATGLAICVMFTRGIDFQKPAKDLIMSIGDGFAIIGLLYVCLGVLIWASTTGFFDIFSYAFKKGAHAIIPRIAKDEDLVGFYEYKMDKRGKQKEKSIWTPLATGFIMIMIAGVFTIVWYQM